MEQTNELVKYKWELIHFKKLLGDVKTSIELYQAHNKYEHHFDRIMKSLEANGVKGYLDAGKEYDDFVYGGKNA